MFDGFRAFRTTVSEGARARHLRSIADALADSGLPLRRRIALAVATAAALGVPATAIASTGAVPGDVLYPVKRAIEPVWGLVDEDVVASNRLDELGVLLDRDVDPEVLGDYLAEARIAVEENGDAELADRFREIEARVRRRPGSPDGGRSEVPPPPAQPATTVGSTHQSREGQADDTARTTTTAARDAPPLSGDRPPEAGDGGDDGSPGTARRGEGSGGSGDSGADR